ncbi:hypothetical protein GH5_08309 [Leishmania sp. Ghana 2012 LV757]|uniref:hypothetical protein n=1 Tax=Leishmania sp. Ghana 2012 LV757 TaxID=2803181 RepID=UPI001B43735D|nr:hypothetical protein GH5_08309 [Leishmania sp. Ghana 2012 LV757]
MAFTGRCAGERAPTRFLRRTARWRRRQRPHLVVRAMRFALLLICGTSVLVAANLTTALPLRSTPADNTGLRSYYDTLLAQDAAIFAGSTAVLSSDRLPYPTLTNIHRLRSVVSNVSAPTLLRTLQPTSTALRNLCADTLSEFFVVMALLYLDASGALPFARTAPIPSTYLPASYTGGAHLINPAFPTVPITLEMLLLHVSSITENGLELGAVPNDAVAAPTLSASLDSLFSITGTTMFRPQQPGLPASYTYSCTNVALISYVLEQILAESAEHSMLSGVGEFIFGVVLAPLQLESTFLLKRNGQIVDATSHPFTGASRRNRLHNAARQGLHSRGPDTLENYPIRAASFADCTLFTTSADMATLVAEVLMPGGLYHTQMGAEMLLSTVPVAVPAMPFVDARATGLFLFNATNLCPTMRSAILYSGNAPHCHYTSLTVSDSAPPFGLVASGALNELAIVCIPVVSSNSTLCSVAALSLREAGTRSGSAATTGNRAVGLAMASLAHWTSEPARALATPMSQSPKQRFNGWFVLLGVVVTLLVVVVASYITDLVIQPPPPAKIIAPAATDQIRLRNGTTLTASTGGGGRLRAVSDTDELVDSESPKAFRENGRGDNGENAYSGSNEDETPYPMRSGVSSLRRPRRLQRRYRDDREASAADNDSYSGDDGRWGDNLDNVDRSSTGRQRPHPKSALRFDAYI